MMITRKLHSLSKYVEISAEVAKALELRKPVVALESTIITHGMPYPENKQTAFAVEEIIRNQNAIPATIAIVQGKLKVGLNQQEIDFLASCESRKDVVKTSRRDLPFVLSQGLSGGTTVAGTMIAASSVGIKVFATGGVGGVHRGGENSLDISADLTELGRTRLAVVCSGVKSILDIGRTLEYLETQGVCVATYGPTKQFPAFYCSRSQYQAPYNVTDPKEAAQVIHVLEQLRMESGVLFAVPVPEEHQLIDDFTMEKSIQRALAKAAELKIEGKAVTPFILQNLAELTKGRSLQTNIALIKNNAFIGAKIAVELENISRNNNSIVNSEFTQGIHVKEQGFSVLGTATRKPVVIGASILDSVVSLLEPIKAESRTLRGRIQQSGGGVGRNIADALGKLTTPPRFVSAVGNDQYGMFLLNETINHLDRSGVLVSEELPTACYSVILDTKGEFQMGIGDMDVQSLITPQHVGKFLQDASMIIMDGNIPASSVSFVLDYCLKYNIPVIFEPTDVAKAAKPFQFEAWKSIKLITPNMKELRRIASFKGLDVGSSEDSAASVEEAVSLATPLAHHIQTVMVTLGALGLVMVGRANNESDVTARHYATTPLESVTSVSGAGDCLAAGVISGMLEGLDEPSCVERGLAAARDSLHCFSAVPLRFSSAPQEPVNAELVHSSVKRSLL